MSEYGDIWVSSARKCRPVEDWHWRCLERDLGLERAVQREIWMMQFFLGASLREKFRKKIKWKSPDEAGCSSLASRINSHYRDYLDLPFEAGAKIITEDSVRIVDAISNKFEKCSETPPTPSLLNLVWT